ncbi:MAG: SDR family NAD(P)-dependent oxidoreductase [Sphingobacteriaceae bacterium]
MSSLANKTILIIGGTSGIGAELVRKLEVEGASVITASRQTTAKHNGIHLVWDATDSTADFSVELPEKLDGLVYCPGTINLRPFARISDAEFLNDFELNVLGAIRAIRQSINALKKSGNASVVLYSTVAASQGMNFHASVATSKKALEGLAISLAAEYAASTVRFNVVAPSLTDTPLAATLLSSPEKKEASDKRHPLGRIGQPSDIAGATLFLLSGESSWMTGQVLAVDGGLSSIKSL